MSANRIGGSQPPSYSPDIDEADASHSPRPSESVSHPTTPAGDGVDLGPSYAPLFNDGDGVETARVDSPIIDDESPPSGSTGNTSSAPIIDDTDGPIVDNVPIIDDTQGPIVDNVPIIDDDDDLPKDESDKKDPPPTKAGRAPILD